jgi:DNA-directed RNA polymerase subunit K/omega
MPKQEKPQKPKNNTKTDKNKDDTEDEEDTLKESKLVKFFEEDYDIFTKKYGIEHLSKTYVENNRMRIQYILVPREDRITSDIMSKAEYARVVAERAKEIENGAKIYVSHNEHDPAKIAIEEIRKKKCPLSIVRIYNNYKEIWPVNEMIIP